MVKKILVVIFAVILSAVGLSTVNPTDRWVYYSRVDIMTNKTVWFAVSPDTEPYYLLPFPYTSITVNLVYLNDGEIESFALVFSSIPGVRYTMYTEYGYIVLAKAKWDNNQPVDMFLVQDDPFNKVLLIVDFKTTNENISRYNKLLIQLPWVSQSAYFEISLKGAAEAIRQAKLKAGR